MRTFLIFVLALAAVGCSFSSDPNEREITLDGDRTVSVFIEEENVDEGKLMVVDYLSETEAIREDKVEEEIRMIWKGVQAEADTRGITEALIKYRYPDPESAAEEPKEYRGLLFEAEKIENGTWKLRKVN